MGERMHYYNPMLDPHCQQKMTGAMRNSVINDTYADGGPLNEPDELHPANLVSSLCTDGLHRPALDIDMPCRVVASSTPGHCHIYFDELALTWESYVDLLNALAKVGVIEERYRDHSVVRGQTLLRPPGIQK